MSANSLEAPHPDAARYGQIASRFIGFRRKSRTATPWAADPSAGLRYLLINSLLRDYQAVYPDGNLSTDAWPAYTTSFAITGKVGNVFEAQIETANSGPPSLV